MTRKYNLNHRLAACFLLTGLFLQSCDGFSNQVIPQEKEQSSRTLELSDNPLVNTGQAIVTSGGYLASFYEDEGELKANLRIDQTQAEPNYKGVPVLVEEGVDLSYLTKLDYKTQQNRIQPSHKNGTIDQVIIFNGGVAGGMMGGTQKTRTSQRIPDLTDMKELRRHFTKGYLEITPKNYKQLVEFSESQAASFTNYEGGLFVKGWETSSEFDALMDLLLSFNVIKKFKINSAREDKAELAEVIGKALQFYKELTELDLNGCGLGDGMIEDILESIAAPEKLRILNVSNNNLSTELVASLQVRLPNAQIRSQGETSQRSIGFSSTASSISSNSEHNSSGKVTPNNSSSTMFDSVSAGNVGTEKTGKEAESIAGLYSPEITAYKRLRLNQFLPAISKDEIEYGRELGHGGFGAVYQASCQGDNVAIKKLLNTSEKQVADFQKEAIIMANHRHNNIVAFLGYCPEENALIMEYMPGGSLASLLKSTKEVSWQERYQIALDVAEGMSYLHDCGIVHCDLKSDNVLLDSNKRAKVTDFGISALKREVTSGKSSYGEWLGGTYRWMAPEIFHTSKNSKAGDVYSYGMVLWELGARKLPFAEIKVLLPLCEHIKAGNQEVVSADTPQELKKVIEQCWLPEPPLKKETSGQDRPTMKRVRYLLEEGHSSFLRRESGEILDQDQDKEIEVYKKAAEQGDAEAQFKLGLCYEIGQGVKIDWQEAVKWYQRAAEQGFVTAQSKLGGIYLAEKNYQEALKWNQKAAGQGDVSAQYNLAWMYGNAKGVTQNYQEALKWNKKAADQGLGASEYNLGWMYERGLGADQNYQEALKWYQKAADQGFGGAQAKVEETCNRLEEEKKKLDNIIKAWPHGEKIVSQLKSASGILDFSLCQLTSEQISILIKHPHFNQIHTFKLGRSQIGDEGTIKLAAALSNSQIHTLDLAYNQIGPAGAIKLAAALPNTQIHTLSLGGNRIGDTGAQELAKILPSTQIHTLYLGDNQIGAVGASKLAATLPSTQLHTLNLDYNQQIGAAGASELAAALPNTQIHTLNLYNNRIGDVGAQELAKVLSSTEIHTLSLGGNQISNAGAQQLANALSNTQIHTVNLRENNISAEMKRLLQQQHPNIKFGM
ncbi:MAG: hypothetical protein BGO68_04700 [Candidatus Amoebophilus sp. 36-38]|nr:MAG: hypothetical protein BGO68_04700 [Candidatus Amoebophilus sp. 36-38]